MQYACESNGVTRNPLDRPILSILVPCWNEKETIRNLLEAIRDQSYPLDRIETVIADGGSTDGTLEEVERYRASNPTHRVLLVHNRKRNIPSGLNLAIGASTGEILMRLDGHSAPNREYIEGCVRLLQEGKGDMVGGKLDVVPRNGGWMARSIAIAASHPAGVGDSHFRFSSEPREVDTIAFCAFHRKWIDRIGLYDETLLSNEDYDFNSRFRRAGGRIWLDPSLLTTYYPPPTFSRLARQYLRYGFWKARMTIKSPGSIRWRQFMPPTTLVSAVLLAGLGVRFEPCRLILAAGTSAYLLVLLSVGFSRAIRKQPDPLIGVGVPIAIATMHLCWASAFLWSLATHPFRKVG